MDIRALASATNEIGLMGQISTMVLSKSLDNMEVMGDGMKKIMEASVQPHLGQNIDYSI
ncbi:MAG: YjfB family protein [Lachnospiraceae bacterium]|nr:YjfB family protein [Lachnospiraceae bacterium]